MGTEITIGGERLGSGKKMKAYMHGYERSTHDLSYMWRSTIACGTLVPFMNQIALPGDTFDIDLNCDIMTKPTTGPLFGSFKVQLDTFLIPLRLYQQALQLNMLDIGMNMSDVMLPQIELQANKLHYDQPIDNQQINPSSLYSYLGIRGLGQVAEPTNTVKRKFNATSIVMYWDIFKQYYANKQEDNAVVIHKRLAESATTIDGAQAFNLEAGPAIALNVTPPAVYPPVDGPITMTEDSYWVIYLLGLDADFDPGNIRVQLKKQPSGIIETRVLSEIFSVSTIEDGGGLAPSTLTLTVPKDGFISVELEIGLIYYEDNTPPDIQTPPTLQQFPLKNIDTMRRYLLTFNNAGGSAALINDLALSPYNLPLVSRASALYPGEFNRSMQYAQEGLAVKTYNSDLFNNWINTEWIDGPDGISAITAIDTSGGSFTIDEINMSQKVYNMLNRIALSGGTYDDWQYAVYDHSRNGIVSNAMYMGGLIKELVFQEVISQAAAEDKPLGTLAGRGRLSGKHKGGNIVIKVDEPAVIMGIISITPRIDYSQGNAWDVNLKNMNELHKPALDEIGFQDLITDKMTWWDTTMSIDGNTTTFKSAGKQPAWIDYMTNVNVVRGNFAEESEMFMVLNRRYEPNFITAQTATIKDLTTYIDPKKFNHIFADTRIDAQNYWTQISVEMKARRKMSAKIIPNL